MRGRNRWEPVPEIVDALDKTFYTSFGLIELTGKRLVLALDVSGSMFMFRLNNIPGLTPTIASGALAMVTLKAETEVHVVAFSDRLCRLPLKPTVHLLQGMEVLTWAPVGATNCALPILWAKERRIPADAFVIYLGDLVG